MREYKMSEEMYDKICAALTDFEEDEELSDGEWLDVFYDLLCEIQRSLV